jgi:hypothetical protein
MLYQITKEVFDGLSDDLKKEYTLDGEAATLKIEGENAPSMAAIIKAEEKRVIEADHRKKAEKARDAAEAMADKLREDLDKASGKDEIARVKAEHQEALEKIRADREAEKTAAKEASNAALKMETARAFAEENFTIPTLMVEQFAKRLSVEEIDGQSVIRCLDADGKASALSLSEVQQEFLANKEFASIIKTKTGSGGGANPSGGGGAAGKSLSDMTATEEAKFANENPEAYAEMVGA